MSTPEPQYICRNFCVPDPDTGVCLTCGRPPLPVVWPGLEEMLAKPALPDHAPAPDAPVDAVAESARELARVVAND